MKKTNKSKLLLLAAFFTLFTLGGCVGMETSNETIEPTENAGIDRNEPYFPTKFSDFEVPGELKQVRKKSLFINTSSFTGGILNFSGRVEVNSLTDFFVNSMQKNGWSATGEVRYDNIMLAFSKANKSCMITIYEGEYGSKTQVYVYITEAMTNSEQSL